MSVAPDALNAPGGLDTRSIVQQLMQRGQQNEAQIADTEAQFKASQAREAAARAAQTAALNPLREQMRARLQQAPEAPQTAALPEAPKAPAIDSKEFSEVLPMIVALASISGLLTRQPLTAALNSFSEGVQGYVQGKQTLFQDKLKEFTASLNKAKAENDSVWKRYQAARDKWGTDIQGMQTEMQLIAAETQNPIDIELAQRGDLVSLMKLHETSNNNFDKVMGNVLKIQESAQAHADQVAARRDAERDRLAIAAQASRDRQAAMETASADRRYAADLMHADRQAAVAARGSGNATQNRMQRVMAIDVDNATYNLGRLAELSADRGELIGGSAAFANHFGGSWTADFKRYLETGAIPSDLQGADALLMNLAFDIASGQSGGSGQLAQSKIAELENQMPLESMPPEVKKERWNALFHRIKAINTQLPPGARQDLSGFEPAFGNAPPPAPHAPQEGQKAQSKSGKPIVFHNGQWEYE